jgi:hypothetical protein
VAVEDRREFLGGHQWPAQGLKRMAAADRTRLPVNLRFETQPGRAEARVKGAGRDPSGGELARCVGIERLGGRTNKKKTFRVWREEYVPMWTIWIESVFLVD